jgi:hypothetical protein
MLKQIICLAAGVGLGYYIHYQQTEWDADERLYQSELEFEKRLQEAKDDMELVLSEEYIKKVAELRAEFEGRTADIPEGPKEEITPPPIPEPVNTALVNYGGVPLMPREPLKLYNRPTEVVETPVDIPPQTIAEQPVTESDFVENEAPPRFKPPKNNPVQIVDETVFENNEDGYPEYTLEYWSENDVMTGETGNVVTDTYRNEILGEEGLALLKAGPEALGGSNLYIRHTDLKSVFEIIWNQGSFVPETEDA